ncbi:hypothetical protein Glove_87g87 [Diversispora epigaea]|uniref:Uncharacterized protein n=1 Tax=Diversispora epigaea TaxID=1348612 RepID=A0A397J6Y7_9GLOM|nr:hypothetical protein Glove_87g87 [Diversispora epigaea]
MFNLDNNKQQHTLSLPPHVINSNNKKILFLNNNNNHFNQNNQRKYKCNNIHNFTYDIPISSSLYHYQQIFNDHYLKSCHKHHQTLYPNLLSQLSTPYLVQSFSTPLILHNNQNKSIVIIIIL